MKEDDTEVIEKELFNLDSNIVHVPNQIQLWTQDTTPEKLGVTMAENSEQIAVMSAEGGFFENIGGRYQNNTPNLDLVLQAHSGDPVRVDRGSRESIDMESPVMSIALSAQPGLLEALRCHSGFRTRGLWARFLFAIPRSPLGYRSHDTIPLKNRNEKV